MQRSEQSFFVVVNWIEMNMHKEGNTEQEKALIKKYCLLSHSQTVPRTISSSYLDIDRYRWVLKLLDTPIADGRHRILRLVLAPFFICVLKMSYENSKEMIERYINECNKIHSTNAGKEIDYRLGRVIHNNYLPSLKQFKEDMPEIANILGLSS